MLPANPHDFRTAAYWKDFFEARGGRTFEWYTSLEDIRAALGKACPLPGSGAPPRVLVPGCGNSALSEELWQAGYRNTLSIDFDEGVVAAMRARTLRACPELEWAVASATALPPAQYPTGSFAAVLDKGLLDAMLPCNDSAEGCRDARAYLSACARLLAPGTGALLVVSLLQEHVLGLVMQHLAEDPASRLWQGLDISFIDQQQQQQQGGAEAATLCPFLLLLRRSSAPFPDSSVQGSASAHPAPPISVAGALLPAEGVSSAVRGLRWSQGLRAALQRVTGETHLSLDLWAAALGSGSGSREGIGAITPSGTPPAELGYPSHAQPLYSCTIVDAAAPLQGAAASSCAVLLVPMGREHEWLFGARAGQRALCKQAGVGRLIFVTLGVGAANGRRFAALSQAQVQAELSPAVLTMLPASSSGGSGGSPAACPYLAVAAELGRREVVAEGRSALSGVYVVEDCYEESEEEEAECAATGALPPFNRRRLIFASNRAALQSEVHLAAGRVSHAPPPCFAYHCAMAAAVAALHAAPGEELEPITRVLVLGLGGGALPSYLASSLPCSPRLHIVAVELDADIVACAAAHFGLPVAASSAPPASASALGAQGSEDRAAAAVHTLAEALTPSSGPSSGSGGRGVRVVVGDALRVLELLAHPTFPPSARPSVILLDVNSGKEELASGLSFPPPTFVTQEALARCRGALGGEGSRQLLAINLGTRDRALAAGVVERVGAAFAGSGSVRMLRPGSLLDGEEEEEEEEEEEQEDINTVLFAGPGSAMCTLAGLKPFVPREKST